jgi:hypothetical protein
MLPVMVIVPIVMRLLGERWAGEGLGEKTKRAKPHAWTPLFIAFVVFIALLVIVTFFSLLLPVLEKSTGLVPK